MKMEKAIINVCNFEKFLDYFLLAQIPMLQRGLAPLGICDRKKNMDLRQKEVFCAMKSIPIVFSYIGGGLEPLR